MEVRKQRLRTAVYIALLLAAGLINYAEALMDPAVSTALATLVISIFLGLLLYWLFTVRLRLLPSPVRRCIISSGLLLLGLLLLRMVRYRLVPNDPSLERFCWYLYYVPVLLVPALFLLSCLHIFRQGRLPVAVSLLPVPSVLLSIGILTNEAHRLAFAPIPGCEANWGHVNSYLRGPLFYAAYVWIGLCIVVGVVLLMRSFGRKRDWKKILLPLWAVLLWLALLLLCDLFSARGIRRFFNFPEIHAFCIVGLYEACIRNRLMPCNENYAEFFRRMRIPAMITDRALSPVYRTSAAVDATKEQLSASLSASVYPQPDLRLSGMPVGAGYAFWIENESELHRNNERLAAANETIRSENELIEAENRLKEKLAHVEFHNRIYADIEQRMYPAQKRLESLLLSAKPNTPTFRETIARALVLCAYIKRGTNLLLLDADHGQISSGELLLAVRESARYLGYCGTKMQIPSFRDEPIDKNAAFSLYTDLERVTEAVLPYATKINIAFSDGELRLTMPDLPLSVPAAKAERADGLLYLTLNGAGGVA